MDRTTELKDIEAMLKAILDGHTMTKDEIRGRVLEAWGTVRRMTAESDGR